MSPSSDGRPAGDRTTRNRSRTGFIAFKNGVPIDWLSRKQCVTSVGSAEAEIYALSEAVKRGRIIHAT